MPESFNIGDRVKWLSREGTVSGFKGNKVMVLLDFMNHELSTSPDSLELIKKKETSKEREKAEEEITRTKPAVGEKRAEMLISLEALRFGLVPWNHIKELTIGYDEMEKWSTRYFPSNQNEGLTVSKIRGDFGEGKSHSLQVVRTIARENGYLTSWIEVDGKQVTFSRPETVLQHVWSHLEGKDFVSTTKLLDLHLQAIDKHGAHNVADKLSEFSRLKQANETIDLCRRNNRLDDFGHRIDCVLSSVPEETASSLKIVISRTLRYSGYINLQPMIGNRIVDRPSDFLETLIGNAFLARLVGYKGLVITVDEFEVESFFSSSKAEREKLERARNILLALKEYGMGNIQLPKAPISLFIATVDEEDTTLSLSYFAKYMDGGTKNLKQLSKQDLHSLARKIHDFYMQANKLNHKFDDSLIEDVENSFNDYHFRSSGYTRAFIKQLMYKLDDKYGPKGAGRWKTRIRAETSH